MIREFMEAAFPWILMGLGVAVCCAFIRKKRK